MAILSARKKMCYVCFNSVTKKDEPKKGIQQRKKQFFKHKAHTQNHLTISIYYSQYIIEKKKVLLDSIFSFIAGDISKVNIHQKDNELQKRKKNTIILLQLACTIKAKHKDL